MFVSVRVRCIGSKGHATAAIVLALVVAMSAAACGGRRAAVRDMVDTLPPIPAHSVEDLMGRWESTVPGLPWVWLVKDDGTVDWTDGRRRGAGRIATQAGRVLFTPDGGESQLFTLYLLPSHRLLLRSERGVRMILTPHRPQ